jgi:ABC-type lipoprotein export system ATPase subunit
LSGFGQGKFLVFKGYLIMIKWGCYIDNLTISWNKKTILQEVSQDLSIKDKNHCKLPIMGETGKGKSSLLYLMAALKRPEEGTIKWSFPDKEFFVWGRNGIEESSSAFLRENLHITYFGFAFQDSTLIPHLTVMENLMYPLEIKGIEKKQALNIAEQVLESVLIKGEKEDSKFKNKYPGKLSAGQKQRVALAQAMVNDPYVLFVDEPTGNLDPSTRKQVMNVLKNWVKGSLTAGSKTNKSKFLIWVTHHQDDPEFMGLQGKSILFVEDKKCSMIDSGTLAAKWGILRNEN